jgi:multisubunit Na+/H+ antiporter MnhC subunit
VADYSIFFKILDILIAYYIKNFYPYCFFKIFININVFVHLRESTLKKFAIIGIMGRGITIFYNSEGERAWTA